ncbi:MAG: pH regulation protein F [Deltaproteobacteria bacterium]|nr:pH regulation protein F [Deltaproteobacteria bacterium]
MNTVFLIAALGLLVSTAIAMVRVVGGPTVLDRIVGVNVVGAQTTILLILIGYLFDNISMFLDIAIAYAMLNFILAIGVTKFFLRRKSARGGGGGEEH